MAGRYILNAAGEPEACPDLLVWGRWMNGDHRLALTELPGDVRVSTVFLGLDHQFGHGAPILWETMIFGGEHDGWQDRYSSRAQAEAGHVNAVAIARGEREP